MLDRVEWCIQLSCCRRDKAHRADDQQQALPRRQPELDGVALVKVCHIEGCAAADAVHDEVDNDDRHKVHRRDDGDLQLIRAQALARDAAGVPVWLGQNGVMMPMCLLDDVSA